MAEITDFGPKKTIFILAIVVGCFAVLWPKIFYPMLVASVTPHHSTDNSACCDVIFESDVTAADIMHEICQNILKHHQVDPRVRDALRSSKLTPQSASLCREEILARCGIDLSSFLAERERLGKSNKQVLEEIRSFNSTLCLKTNFGIPLSQLGTPHLIRYHILMPHSTIRQERRTPPHAGGLHPALRERGRAIPSSHVVPKVADRPERVVPKMRPPFGGGGHVVPATKGNGTMGIVMPLYTLGIVLFFLYTIVKVLNKNSDNEILSEYPGAAAEKEFRKMVFSPEVFASAMTGSAVNYQKERSPSPHRPTPTLEELQDLDGAPKSNRLAEVDRTHKDDTTVQDTASREDEDLESTENSPTVKIIGMEMTASCEGGQRGSRPTTPIIPTPPSHAEREKTPPKPIYLEGALPSQCELLVTDSETQAQKAEEDAEAPVVLSGKMTLSLISLDQIAAESEDENPETQEAEGVDRAELAESGEKLSIIETIDKVEREEKVKRENVEIEEGEPKGQTEEKAARTGHQEGEVDRRQEDEEKRKSAEEEIEVEDEAEEEDEEEIEVEEEEEEVEVEEEEEEIEVEEEEEEVEVEEEEVEEIEVEEEEEEVEEEEVEYEEEEEEVEEEKAEEASARDKNGLPPSKDVLRSEKN